MNRTCIVGQICQQNVKLNKCSAGALHTLVSNSLLGDAHHFSHLLYIHLYRNKFCFKLINFFNISFRNYQAFRNLRLIKIYLHVNLQDLSTRTCWNNSLQINFNVKFWLNNSALRWIGKHFTTVVIIIDHLW